MKSEKAMTLEDLASTLGMSRSSVSRAFTGNGRIAPQTREKVLKAARELGYQPNLHAQRLAGGRCQNTIGLFSLGLDYGVTTQKIKLIQQLLSDQGFHVPLYAYSDYTSVAVVKQAELMSVLRRQQPRAIVCASRGLEPDALLELKKYHDEGGIVVCYDYPIELDCDQVIFDREDNNYQAARHLLELGHRDLGLYIEGEQTPDPEMPLIGSRVAGFERALGEYGAPVNEAWKFHGAGAEEGRALLARQFLALSQRPMGVCIVNDRAATTFVNEVQRAGVKVPTDVSVVCHDDQPVASYGAVRLSSATHPAQEIAQSVIELLSSRFDGSYPGEARRKWVRGSFIERDSTSAPRAVTYPKKTQFANGKGEFKTSRTTILASNS